MCCDPTAVSETDGMAAARLFRNSEERLRREVARALEDRARLGLDGLVGDLVGVVINVEPEMQRAAVAELVHYTGFEVREAFEDPRRRTCVLRAEASADILVTARLNASNPFALLNQFPKSRHLPDTRLETFVFECRNLDEYTAIQKSRGIDFMTDNVYRNDAFSFIETAPSPFTGNAVGLIEWHDAGRGYGTPGCRELDWRVDVPAVPYRGKIKELDHVATRVKAEARDAAIVEFLRLTNYGFDFAIYVKSLNSITNVARMPGARFAMVFTSGIAPYRNDEVSGPTERFTHNYGPRAHHMAFRTEDIDATYDALCRAGMSFMVELVGSEEEGLKQAFSAPSKHTLLVNEYIHRYEGFDGFFTKGNVTLLTKGTEKQ